RREGLTLRQTRLLRKHKLSVMDQVSNAVTYYDTTFRNQLPLHYTALEDHLAKAVPGWKTDDSTPELAPCLRPGSWIGGDRDGNPFVTADVLIQAVRVQSRCAMDFYIPQLKKLSSELSAAAGLIDITPALQALAEKSPETSPHREAEPYR